MLFFDILAKKRQNESFGNVKIVSNKSIDLKKVKMNGESRSFLLFNRARDRTRTYTSQNTRS